MKYPAIIAAVALALVAVGLMARNADLPYATDSKEALERYREGVDELNAFRFDRAVAALERAVAADPDFALAHAALAGALISEGDSERGKRAAHRADSLAAGLRKPEERILVQLLSRRGTQGVLAVDSLLAEAARLMPREPIVMDLQAQVAMNQGRLAVADSLWRELLQMDPNFARAYNWLGYVAANEGDYEQALAHLRKYAFLAPDLANPHDSLGEIMLQTGNYEEAEAELRRALELQPDFYFSLMNIAQLYIATGRVGKAVDLLGKLREQFAGTGYQRQVDETRIFAYQIHGLEADRRRAVAEYVQRHAGKPADGGIWRSFMLVDLGRPAEARAALDSVIVKVAKDSGLPSGDRRQANLQVIRHALEAAIARNAGELATAVDQSRSALALADFLAPHERIPLRVSFARTLSLQGSWADVLEQTGEVLRINPRHISALSLQVRAESALGRREEATRTLAALRASLALADPGLPARAVADSLSTVLGVAAGV